MALVVADRVKEITTTTGTGTLTLAGAVQGYQGFSAIGDGNTTYYAIQYGADWEVGIGTYTASGTTLSRDTILDSSNSGSAVPFGAGIKEVFVTLPAERAVYTSSSATMGTGVSTALTEAVTGTGGIVLASSASLTSATITSSTFISANLGTPTSLTLTNATGLPVGGIFASGTPSNTTFLRGDGSWQAVNVSPAGSDGDIQINSSGSFGALTPGTGVSTALGLAVSGSGSIVLAASATLVTPNLGTPSSLTLTNATGLPVSGIFASGTPSNTTFLRGDGSWQVVSVSSTAAIGYIIDGGGEPITTGTLASAVQVPFAGTINSVTLLADQTGSIVVDIWKDTYANFPPTVADSICASAKPTLSSARKSENTTLSGWTTSVAAGDTFLFNVDSASTVQNVTLILKVTKA